LSLDKIFIALDQMSEEEIKIFLSRSNTKIKNVKIGLELFLKYGPQIIDRIYSKFNVDIFLDLKLYDIPNTISKSISALNNLPIKYLTLHLQGGEEMLQSAFEAKSKLNQEIKLLGVSVLTSFSHEQYFKTFNQNLNEQTFLHLFNIAKKTKMDGIICSPFEINLLKKTSKELLAVTPGIRFDFELNDKIAMHDQKRVMGPNEAFLSGADFLVIGRSLTTIHDDSELHRRLDLL
jgi:orotidine-5'-phosphate decarboxylase